MNYNDRKTKRLVPMHESAAAEYRSPRVYMTRVNCRVEATTQKRLDRSDANGDPLQMSLRNRSFAMIGVMTSGHALVPNPPDPRLRGRAHAHTNVAEQKENIYVASP